MYRILITGIVQGVGFRPTVYRVAKELNLKGFVRNNGTNVEIRIDKKPEIFIRKLKEDLPTNAKIENIEIKEIYDKNQYTDFVIHTSNDGHRKSLVPADTCICNECITEIFSSANRRYMYPFTNCTSCGARFTIIDDIPYDRGNTSMRAFKLCEKCDKEYTTPDNRRFHAQTISCIDCGPRYVLYNKNREIIECENPLERFALYIDAGYICVLKGWGGMHICCNLQSIEKLREWYGRKQKPFAVMIRNLETLKKYVEITGYEEKIISSLARPIVLLKKKNNTKINKLLENISPSLPNIGVMLPYSGIHYILFRYLKTDGIVLTSANIPHEPMIIINDNVFTLNADYYLLHNRNISNRCDDSVLRVYKKNLYFIRKSRGFIPYRINVNYNTKVLSVGAEENVTTAISTDGYIYPTQYIGNVRYYNTFEFMKRSTEHMLSLFKIRHIDGVGIDMHPLYQSRKYGLDIAERYHANIIEIQHHWAHAVSLMVDNKIDLDTPIIALTLDGAGYGDDGNIWGGEIIVASYKSFTRVGSLEEIPLIGGDAAVKDTARIVFVFTEKAGIKNKFFTDTQVNILQKMMNTAPITTSFGRILDALSCYFNVCRYQTYDGEPAMKIESLLEKGKKNYEFDTKIINTNGRKIISTTDLFSQLIEITSGKKIKNDMIPHIIYSFVYSLLDGLVTIAIENSDRYDTEYIGLTGGVSYNSVITRIVEDMVNKNNKRFLIHNNVPNGDGGISIGQNAIVGYSLD